MPARDVSAMRREHVRALIAATLPDASQTLLLRACLSQGEGGAAAWCDWLACTPDPIVALDGARTLLPLLAAHAGTAGVSAELRALLKAAYVRERARYDTYRRIAATALSALGSRGVTPVVLKGAALAESVYAEPWLRHCHDVDLLVSRSQLAAASAGVVAAGFHRLPSGDAGTDHLAFAHASGLPLRLHAEPFLPRAYAMAETFAALAVAREVCGVAVRVLPPAAALVHVLGHASYQRASERLRWACDAWTLIDRGAPFDWDAAAALAIEAGLALPLEVQLAYLADALSAPVAAAALAVLRQAPVSALHLRAAELGALSGAWRDVVHVLAVGRPVARVATLTRLLRHVVIEGRGVAAGFPLPTVRALRRTGP